jgi:signal transduction histidine kinase
MWASHQSGVVFFLIIPAFAIALHLTINCYRRKAELDKQNMRSEIAKDLHDQVGSTLSSIAVYAGVAGNYQSSGEGVELNNVLQDISKAAHETIDDMGDIVWALNQNGNDMLSIIQRINKYAAPLCKACGIDFSFYCYPNILHKKLNLHVRKNLHLLIKEAINNAVKHAGCTTIRVSITRNKVIELHIQDDGCGIDLGKLKFRNNFPMGNGLRNMESRAEAINGTLTICNSSGSGCLIKLKLPEGFN